MFQFIRRHQAIGLIFIGIVIVSFVIFFSPNQSRDMARLPAGALGTIGGRNVEREEYIAAMREARITHWLREGQWPGRGGRDWDEQRETLNRLVLLEDARRLGVGVSDEVAAARILELPFLRDERAGKFNQTAYDQFLGIIRSENGMSRADFEQFMRHDIALQHLVQLGGMSGGLVTPREAEARYRAGNEQFSGQVAVFSATSHVASVDLSPNALLQFYSNRVAQYRIPERVQVRYVKFALTNFNAEAEQTLSANTNLTALLDSEYTRRGPEAFRDPQGNPQTPEAARETLLAEFRRSVSVDAARKKANEFANRLYQMDANPESLGKLAAESGFEAASSLPFDQFRPPSDMRVPATFPRQAFALSADEPFATPIVGDDGVYIVSFERRIPSEIQPFESVRERVTDAVRVTQSRTLAEGAGTHFALAAATAISEGKTFEAAAMEAGVTPIVLTNFSRTTTAVPGIGPRLTVGELLRAAEDLTPGKAGSFTPGADGGFVLFLAGRNAAADEDVKKELPAYIKQARQFGRFSSFSEWQKKRFAAASVSIPRTLADTNSPAASGSGNGR